MLELKVNDGDNEVMLKFEHSLLSLSKWESKHKEAFLATPTKKSEDLIDYFECMLVSPESSTDLVYRLSPAQLDQLSDYINDPMTASSVPDIEEGPKVVETTTSELIYYWMVALKIPFHPAETWHLNRLMMLVRITNYKSQPEDKRKSGSLLQTWREMNARNKEKFGTKG